MSVNNTFGNVCETWNTYCFTWSDCIAEAVTIVEGGARNPQEWGDHPFDLYEDQQKALLDYQIKNPSKNQSLIQIYIKCVNKKYNKNIVVPNQKPVVKVEDVKFILNTLKEVGVDIKNIKNYNDDQLNNLLT